MTSSSYGSLFEKASRYLTIARSEKSCNALDYDSAMHALAVLVESGAHSSDKLPRKIFKEKLRQLEAADTLKPFETLLMNALQASFRPGLEFDAELKISQWGPSSDLLFTRALRYMTIARDEKRCNESDYAEAVQALSAFVQSVAHACDQSSSPAMGVKNKLNQLAAVDTLKPPEALLMDALQASFVSESKFGIGLRSGQVTPPDRSSKRPRSNKRAVDRHISPSSPQDIYIVASTLVTQEYSNDSKCLASDLSDAQRILKNRSYSLPTLQRIQSDISQLSDSGDNLLPCERLAYQALQRAYEQYEGTVEFGARTK